MPEIKEPVEGICRVLFPELQRFDLNISFGASFRDTWLRTKRICTQEFFNQFFLLRVTEGDVSQAQIQTILSQSDNREHVARNLTELLQNNRIKRFLERLQFFPGNIPTENLQTFLLGLFDLGDSLPAEADVPLDLSPYQQCAFTTESLLAKVDRESRANTLYQLASSAKGLSALVYLVSLIERMIGDPRDLDSERTEFISVDSLDDLRQVVLARIRDEAETSQLSSRPALAMILSRWKDWTGEEEPKRYAARLLQNDEGLLDLLTGFVTHTQSWGGQSGAITRTPMIHRTAIDLFINGESVRERVQAIRERRWESLTDERREAVEAFLDAMSETP